MKAMWSIATAFSLAFVRTGTRVLMAYLTRTEENTNLKTAIIAIPMAKAFLCSNSSAKIAHKLSHYKIWQEISVMDTPFQPR